MKQPTIFLKFIFETLRQLTSKIKSMSRVFIYLISRCLLGRLIFSQTVSHYDKIIQDLLHNGDLVSLSRFILQYN